MIDKLMVLLAPHYCSGCDKIGYLLCDNCKNDIIDEAKNGCLVCQKPCDQSGVCGACRSDFDRAWYVGRRAGVLQRLIGLYKFERVRSAFKVLADLMLTTLPELPSGTVIVPIPTVSGHVRERGYDHMMLIAKYIAKKRGLSVSRALKRRTNTKQRQSSAAKRADQAKNAFEVLGKLDPNTVYLLIDDVVTTGATIKYASRQLRKAGARQIWIAAIARQGLD